MDAPLTSCPQTKRYTWSLRSVTSEPLSSAHVKASLAAGVWELVEEAEIERVELVTVPACVVVLDTSCEAGVVDSDGETVEAGVCMITRPALDGPGGMVV